MFRPISLFIGLRYTRAKRRNQFISFVSLVSLLGMILGVVALVVVMSVMNGFEAELRNRVLSVVPHAFVVGPENHLADWRQYQQPLSELPQVEGVAPYIDHQVMLSRPGIVRGVKLNAIDPVYENNVSTIADSMREGTIDSLLAGQYNIVMGEILARHMGLYLGDEISVILPRVTVTPLGIFPRVKRFTVSGTFSVGADLDSNTVFVHLRDGQKLFQYGDDVEGVRVQFDDLLKAQNYLPDIQALLPEGVETITWRETQGSLFNAVAMEKTMISLLLLIIVAIAAFNIVSILTMMVADKRSDIAVLRTMGASGNTILAVFMIQGVSIGLLGVMVGLAIGIPVAINVGEIVIWLESLVGIHVFNPDVYYISKIPSVLAFSDVVKVSIWGLVLSLLATIYPSIRASKVQPAEALRYE